MAHGRTTPLTHRPPTDLMPQTALEVGDRFELVVQATEADRHVVLLPPHLSDLADVRHLTDAQGADVPWSRISGDAIQVSSRGAAPRWIEWAGDNRFRLLPDLRNDDIALDDDLELDSSFARLLDAPEVNRDAERYRISTLAAQLSTQQGFDTLIGLSLIRDFEPLEHQVRTARTVLQRMRGRAMLCDEVGMGKTIEAGLVLLELLKRGLARSVLVITPPSLIEQWRGEMLRKFGIELTAQGEDTTRAKRTAWCAAERVIASIHTAKREPYRSALLNRKWDAVIIDEAHHLRNRNTQMWKFASEIEKQSILLLTATPVQNNLNELFNLVTLLEPGLLSTQKDFAGRFVDKRDAMAPKNVDELHGLLAEVMVRNRRSTSGLHFTQRIARTESVSMSAGEQAMHDRLAGIVRGLLRSQTATDDKDEPQAASADDATRAAGQTGAGLTRMALLTLQMAMGSSAAAAAQMLDNLLVRHRLPPPLRSDFERLRELGQTAGHAKLDRLLELIDAFGDKMVVFTQFRATQELILRRLQDAGIDAVAFHGSLSRLEKESAIRDFQERARVLVCTESGSEGRNLQFAHGLCNYDLPWNPMKIEQRIGRLSRIGQKHDVHVFNLVARGTIEQAVLHLLDAKLSMFELVIGEIDMVLGNLDEEKEFPEMIAEQWAASSGDDEFAARMEVLGNRLLAAKAAYLRQKSADEKLFGNRFAPDA